MLRAIKIFFQRNPVFAFSITIGTAIYVYTNWDNIKDWFSKILKGQTAMFESPIKVKTKITTLFGVKDALHSTPHNGIDLAVPIGTPIYAPQDGVCYDISNSYGGVQLKIQHVNGYATGYGHLQKLNVKNGQKVKKGDLVAYAGNSGSHTSGPHIHFTLTDPKGYKIDPLKHFSFTTK